MEVKRKNECDILFFDRQFFSTVSQKIVGHLEVFFHRSHSIVVAHLDI